MPLLSTLKSKKKLGHLKVKDFCPFSSITKVPLGMDFFHRKGFVWGLEILGSGDY